MRLPHSPAHPETAAAEVHALGRGRSRKLGAPAQDDLVQREFRASAPDRLWVVDFERHEVLLNRVEVGDLRRRVVAAAR